MSVGLGWPSQALELLQVAATPKAQKTALGYKAHVCMNRRAECHG